MRWLLLLLLLLLSACARVPEPLWTDVPEATTLLEILQRRTGTNSTLDAAATVSITIAERHFSTQQFILVEQPDRVRVDALTGFGQLVMQLASDGDILSVLLNTTSPPRFYRGKATQENFSHFVRLPLPPQLLVPMLLYDPPVFAYQRAQVRKRGEQLELLLVNDTSTQSFFFDGQLQLTGSEFAQQQETLLTVDYSRFAATDGFPRRIALHMPLDDVQFAMRINELSLNDAIPAERFILRVPAGIAAEPMPGNE